MKTSVLLKKFQLENREFVTSRELKEYCKQLNIDYESLTRYYLARGYFLRIFKGIFYVKSLDELKLGKTKYNHLELVAKGLQLKGVTNWYFGLYTALKLNNLTHEHFAIDYVVNDQILRTNPMSIAGHKFKFIKLKSSLFTFGITKNVVTYSDPEKTLLDFIYMWRYNGIPKQKIAIDVKEWSKNTSKPAITKYAKNYPKTVQDIAREVIQ